ncbi:hypothetical protein CC2G_011104 [Coprinopsis cinerea AmutBmut pab1-1]|nr:hypothetical protein CC2G_011104 [Coprinopsis cinerea AmutBmut pab1-1]
MLLILPIQAAIALVRKPASVLPNSKEYKGPVLFNPGGPGQSGVAFVLGLGDHLAQTLGSGFDIVGFDPRGIARSTPRTTIFPTPAERAFFQQAHLNRIVNASGEGVERAWGVGHVIGKLAQAHDEEEGGYLEYINTPNTARDMLRIVRAFGREKIQYWGFSYGTVLGATFAAMFPENVERMVLDGVVDIENWYNGIWGSELQDASSALDHFFQACAASPSPKNCALHDPDASVIKARYYDLADRIKHEPIAVHTESLWGGPTYGLLDHSKFQTVMLMGLYFPYRAYSFYARALRDLLDGHPDTFFAMDGSRGFQCECDRWEVSEEEVVEGRMAVECADAAGWDGGAGLEEARRAFEAFSGGGEGRWREWAGVWAGARLNCLRWPRKIPGKPDFEGPFVANTSHPILFIGNTADPVTPLAHAHKVSQGFPGSIVLTQDSPGHASLAATSFCTQLHIREYFVNGTLPQPGTVCDVEGELFPDSVWPFGESGGGEGVGDSSPAAGGDGELEDGALRRARRDSKAKRDEVKERLAARPGLEGVDVEQWMYSVEKLSREAAGRRVYGPL